MDYKKKLKQRLYIGIIYIALGVMLIVGVFSSKSNNDFISALGFAIAMVGVARIIQYLKIFSSDLISMPGIPSQMVCKFL